MAEDSRRTYLEVLCQDRNVTASVRSVEVEDNDRLIDKATVVLDDPSAAGSASVQEGMALKIDLGWMTEHAVLFEGRVARVEGAASGGTRRLTVTAYDLSHLMHRETRRQTYSSGTLSSVLRQICGRYAELIEGEIVVDPDPSYSEDDPLRQANVTDLQLVYDLAHRHRSRFFVEYNEGRSRFYFIPESRLVSGDSMGTLHFCQGFSQVIEFSYQRVASCAAAQRTAVAVDPTSGAATPATPPPDPPPAPAADTSELADLADRRGGESGAVLDSALQASGEAPEQPAAQVRRGTASGLPSDPRRAQDAVRQDPTRIVGLRGQGLAVGTIMLRAKGKVTVEGIAPWAAGDWYVQKATHIHRDRAYRTRFVLTR